MQHPPETRRNDSFVVRRVPGIDASCGIFLGVSFADFVSDVDHWIAFILLGIIGGNMIKESLSKEECCSVNPDFSFRTMLPMAVATSIDALAIGVSFAFLKVNIWSAVAVIGVTTALFQEQVYI